MPLDKYDPQALQAKWNDRWAEAGVFHSEPTAGKQPFTVVIPPPNVTGALHLGHALNGTLQDVVVRQRRMAGFETLWMPGADHAGIATQAVVEKRLLQGEGLSRHDVGRDGLVERIWKWKDEYEARIKGQLAATGVSVDWERWRFTLDERCAAAVRQTFFDMFREGLIFRGKRLVNWDTHLQTSVADDEVEQKEIDGHLWHFRYPVEGEPDRFVEIATTRPETMLGDTAVAVHPKDERYADLVGRNVRLPLVDRLIPVVADGILVKREFGTGVVKVTPAHDPNDYACGLRNDLEQINILHPDGTVNENGGKYEGMDVKAARKAVLADLDELGLLVKSEKHRHAVPHSDRSKTPIQPYLSDQWFVRMADLADEAMRVVRDGEIAFHPPRYADGYLAWLGEKRDWCISRQLWWGHQLPIWYCDDVTEKELDAAFLGNDRVVWTRAAELVDERTLTENLDVRHDGSAHRFILCSLDDLAADAVPGKTLVRDPDVLDTWFSSGLWPHSTLGWPDRTPELEYYYPTSLLSTAREIITLWVARMVVMSQFNTGKIPFADVYIHPVIQDGDGRKMSKSLGNGVDPFDIIAKYGADAMRYTLAAMTTETQDVRMPVAQEELDGRTINVSDKFELGRNFGTKVYNAGKLIVGSLDDYVDAPVTPEEAFLEDRWILHRLHAATAQVTAALDGYRFAEAAKAAYEFFWNDLCDWHLEIVKARLRDDHARPLAQRIVAGVLDQSLRLLHPFMPYLTEELWAALNQTAPTRTLVGSTAPAEMLCVADWPAADAGWTDETVDAQFASLQEVVRAFRNVRAEFNVKPKVRVPGIVDCPAETVGFLHAAEETVKTLAGLSSLELGTDLPKPPRSATQVLPGCKVYVPLEDLIDRDAEIAKQTKNLADLEKRLAAVAGKLANGQFVANAPAPVVQKQRDLHAEIEAQMTDVRKTLAEL